jgi:hydrogenase expression/formation protein HypD
MTAASVDFRRSFAEPSLLRQLAARIAERAVFWKGTMTFMEVCGTHTMAIHQYAIRSLLPANIRLISGPGCPVCVTPNSYLDRAIALARQPEVIIATFGDMLRVPGSTTSLMAQRARGGDIRIVYSPLDAVALAQQHPTRKVVFLGVGFETTAPTVAGSIKAAAARGLGNYFVLSAHKTVPGVMSLLAADPGLSLDGFICPAHVSVVIGAAAYAPLATTHGRACVVTGFEPADILRGMELLLEQVMAGDARVENEYSRAVKEEGNARAQALLAEVFEPCAAEWRGIGTVEGSGLRLAAAYSDFDAETALPVEVEPLKEHQGCRCGDILTGRLQPQQCPLFGSVCRPESPVGACMVSSEGSCAAAYKYGT